jgi:hypothetical protein
MADESVRKASRDLLVLFWVLNGLIVILWLFLPARRIDLRVLVWGNILLLILGMISVKMNLRALTHQNVQAFLRLMYGSFILKFFVLALAAFLYIYLEKEKLRKPALAGCFAFYIFYTFVELKSVMKKSKKPDA